MFLLCFLEGECGKRNIEPPIEDAYSPLFLAKIGDTGYGIGFVPQ